MPALLEHFHSNGTELAMWFPLQHLTDMFAGFQNRRERSNGLKATEIQRSHCCGKKKKKIGLSWANVLGDIL